MSSPAIADVTLVHGAQSGDIESMASLLAQHQSAMRAAAVGMLGYRHDVDDAVQEASLTAVRRISDLREPNAVSGWLRAIVRNQCRMQLRARAEIPIADPGEVAQPDSELDPAHLLDRQALGNWMWHAVDSLSPSLQLVTMLRYFTAVTSYQQIANVCQIPVGTVRSRLSHARAQLAERVLATADLTHGDMAALTSLRRREAEQTLAAAHQGRFIEAVTDLWSPDVEMLWPQGKRTTGFDYPVGVMYRDLSDGVSHRLVNVVASRETVIWEAELISPADDPSHCPPGVLWVQSFMDGRVSNIRLFHPEPDPKSAAPL
jgi:RNA polymerase sigma-70 factor, ECF subfamily